MQPHRTTQRLSAPSPQAYCQHMYTKYKSKQATQPHINAQPMGAPSTQAG